MNFPRVRPLGNRTPWSAPQTIEAVPEVRTIRPAIASGAVVQAREAAPVREAHRYAQINGSIVIGDPTGDGVLALAAPQNFRNFLMIRCTIGAVYVDFGREASVSSPLFLGTGAIVLFDTVVPQDDVYIRRDGLNGGVSIAFGNINFLESTG